MAREKPLQRFLASVVHNAHRISLVLIVVSILGLLALPLLDRYIRFEEKGLLAGVAHATVGTAGSTVFQQAARIARVAAGAGNFQRPGAAAALASELRAAGLASTQLTRPTVFPPGAPPCRCANLHTLVRSRRGDGLEALAVVTPVAFAPQRPDPATDGRNQSAAAAELALLTGAALALHLAGLGGGGGGGGGGGAGGGPGAEGGRWLARDVVWVVPDMSCGGAECLAAWVDTYHGRPKPRRWQPQAPASGTAPAGRGGLPQASVSASASATTGAAVAAAAAAAGAATAATAAAAAAPPLLRGGVIQQAVVLEALAGPGEYDTAELLVAGHEGLLPKLDMFYLLRHLFGYTITPALWRDDQLAPGAPTPAGRLHRALLGLVEAVAPTEAARSYVVRLVTGLQFAWQQAVGLPAGCHAAFKEYMVDAATVRLVKRGTPRSGWLGPRGSADAAAHAQSLASCIELALRSLNNLVERVHHSPFLYVLTGVERFVSVERYVGPAAALAAVLQLQAAWSMRCVHQTIGAALGRSHGVGGASARIWAVAASRAVTRAAVLTAAAAALRDAACSPTLQPAASSGWAAVLTTGRSLLGQPLLEPRAAAAAVVLLGSIVGITAAATSISGRLAAAAWGQQGSGDNGSGDVQTGSATEPASAVRPNSRAATGAAPKPGRPHEEEEECRTGVGGLHGRQEGLMRTAVWHAERVIVLTATAAALTPLVCLNWAAALVAAAYLAPLALGQGWAAPGVQTGGSAGGWPGALTVWTPVVWTAVAPQAVLYTAAVALSGDNGKVSASDGLCRLSETNYWYVHIVAASFWVFGLPV